MATSRISDSTGGALRDRRLPRRALHAVLALSTLAAAVAEPATAQPSANGQPGIGWTAFTRQFDEYVARDGVVGASVLTMRDGRVTARHHTGFADRARNVPVTDSTIFHWGSITKTLTAIAVMQLRDRGRLTLDDRITRYLPELRRLHDPFGTIDSITLRMLLSHTAGFRGGTWPYASGRSWEPFEPTSWEQLVAMMPYQELAFRAGTRYGYSNPGFIYLARVIESVTGDPWESYVQKNVFTPLALTRSYFRSTPYHLAAHRSHGYDVVRDSVTGAAQVVDHGADFDPGITVPNGGWNAPLDDLARYAAFLTGKGSAAATPIVARATLEEMWRPILPMAQGYESSADNAIGLSFFLVGSGGAGGAGGAARLVGHTGSQGGFRAFLYFNPATSATVIAAFNTSNSVRPASADYAALVRAAQAMLR